MLNPQEEVALAQTGRAIAENLLVAVFMSLFYGIYILIFPVAVMSLVRKGLNRLANRAMFILTLLTFVSTTAFWATYIAEYVAIIHGNLSNNFEVPLESRGTFVTGKAIKMYMIILWPQLINFMIGDAIVVWRVWSLYVERPYIRKGLVILWTLTAVSYTLYTSWRQHLMVKNGSPTFDPVAEKLQVICFSLSCGTNVIGTGLVGYKAWQFRKMIKLSSGGTRNPSIVQKVLDLLTESGVFYCALQLIFLILNALDDNKPLAGSFDTATHILIETAIILGAIYPLVTFILISRSRAIADTTRVSSRSRTKTQVVDTVVDGRGDFEIEVISRVRQDGKELDSMKFAVPSGHETSGAGSDFLHTTNRTVDSIV